MPQNGGMSPAVLRNLLPAIPAPAHARCGRGARPIHAAAAGPPEGPVGRRGRGWGVGHAGRVGSKIRIPQPVTDSYV